MAVQYTFNTGGDPNSIGDAYDYYSIKNTGATRGYITSVTLGVSNGGSVSGTMTCYITSGTNLTTDTIATSDSPSIASVGTGCPGTTITFTFDTPAELLTDYYIVFYHNGLNLKIFNNYEGSPCSTPRDPTPADWTWYYATSNTNIGQTSSVYMFNSVVNGGAAPSTGTRLPPPPIILSGF